MIAAGAAQGIPPAIAAAMVDMRLGGGDLDMDALLAGPPHEDGPLH